MPENRNIIKEILDHVTACENALETGCDENTNPNIKHSDYANADFDQIGKLLEKSAELFQSKTGQKYFILPPKHPFLNDPYIKALVECTNNLNTLHLKLKNRFRNPGA